MKQQTKSTEYPSFEQFRLRVFPNRAKEESNPVDYDPESIGRVLADRALSQLFDRDEG